MNMLFSRCPKDPALNLVLAAVQGVLIGSLLMSAVHTAHAQSGPCIVAELLGGFLFLAAFSSHFVGVFLLLYAAPLLWIMLRLCLAGPATALLVALAPGVAALAISDTRDAIDWFYLCIGAAIGLSFVSRAYRGSTGDSVESGLPPESTPSHT
jgi:hypothetical protein